MLLLDVATGCCSYLLLVVVTGCCYWLLLLVVVVTRCYDMDLGFVNLASEDNTVKLEILTEELKLRNQPPC